jgi:murein endopeptidase
MGRMEQRRVVRGANTRTAGKDQARGRWTARGVLCAVAGSALVWACDPPAARSPVDARRVAVTPALPSPPPSERETTREAAASRTLTANSLGPTRAGRLEGGTTLPVDQPWLQPTPAALRRGALHADEHLVGALTRAARHVAETWPGSILWVGDLSREGGGPFPPHASHTNGRDADLAFYTTAPDGRARDTGAMRAVDGAGVMGGGPLRFDAARNWRLVELLLRDPSIQVQWIFVATHVRALLLEAAKASGAEVRILERAARVLQPPRDSSPHADHFHVRIYCDSEDRLLGCVDAPPFHPWIDTHEDIVRDWLEGLQPFLALPGTEEFRFALDRIARVHATTALPTLEGLRTPEAPDDAALLEEVIRHLRGRPTGNDRWRELAPTDAPP